MSELGKLKSGKAAAKKFGRSLAGKVQRVEVMFPLRLRDCAHDYCDAAKSVEVLGVILRVMIIVRACVARADRLAAVIPSTSTDFAQPQSSWAQSRSRTGNITSTRCTFSAKLLPNFLIAALPDFYFPSSLISFICLLFSTSLLSLLSSLSSLSFYGELFISVRLTIRLHLGGQLCPCP